MEELKTSEEWQKLNPDIKIYDPDGWDRTNFEYSWFEEKITLEEYNKRMFSSTCMVNKKRTNTDYENN